MSTLSDYEFERRAIEVGLDSVPEGMLACRYYSLSHIVSIIVANDDHPFEDAVSFLGRNIYSLNWRFAESCLDSLLKLEYKVVGQGRLVDPVTRRVLIRLDDRARGFSEDYNELGAGAYPKLSFFAFGNRDIDPLLLLNLRLIRDGRNRRPTDHTLGSGLSGLALHNAGLTDFDLSLLNGLKTLRFLDISYNPVNGSGLQSLVLPSLQMLRLDGCKLQSKAFQSKLVHSVTNLSLLDTNTLDEHIFLLAGSKITDLDLRRTFVTAACFKQLETLTDLQRLKIDREVVVTGASEQISNLDQLSRLTISGDPLPLGLLEKLQASLRSVQIEVVPVEERKVLQ